MCRIKTPEEERPGDRRTMGREEGERKALRCGRAREREEELALGRMG